MAPLLKRIAKTLAAIPLLALAVACEAPRDTASPVDEARTAPSLQVVTTVLPLTLFTEAIAGDCARVVPLLPVGADPHSFQARPADLARLRRADVLVINGLGLERFLLGLRAAADNSQLRVIDSSQGIKPLPLEPLHAAHHGHAEGQPGAAPDPHIWLDPRLAMQQVSTIRDGLVAADPSCAEGYRSRARAYLAELKQLDDELAATLEPVAGRTVVGFHAALAYFAHRYRLHADALVALPQDQPTPGDLQRLAQVLQAQQVRGVLQEPGAGSAALKALAADLDLKLAVFDPLAVLSAGERADAGLYGRVMRRNGRAVLSTLQP